MVTKEKFELLKDIPNILDLSSSSIRQYIVEDGVETLHSILYLLEKKVKHFTKDKVYSVLKSKNQVEVLYLPSYPLPVTYNNPTDQIIINLSSFNTREISTMNPTPRDLYGCLVYGICFRELIKTTTISEKLAGHITAYLLSVFIRLFGKEYGLIGIYSTQIPKLKFVISCYIYGAFFNITGDQAYKSSSVGVAYNYRDDYELLKKFDFTNVNDFIKALDQLKVLPGLSKYNFVSKILRLISIHFIPAIEDCSRFISVLLTSSIPGITPSLSPAFYYRYNENEFDIIMQMANRIFK